MLTELRIHDFAIIDELTLDLGAGFIVFTGETGAGKSIIIDAVEVLLGGRAESTMIRTGADIAHIEGTFHLDNLILEEVIAILERESLLDDPKVLTLAREIKREGKNISRVNGRVVNLGLMRELGQWLVDVHGQSEHLSLKRVREHIQLLDRYAHVENQRQAFAEAFQELGRARAELSKLRHVEQDAAQRAEMLTFQINEIEAAALQPGEEKALREERTRLSNAEQLSTLTEQTIAHLDESLEERDSAKDLLGRATHSLSSLANLDASLEDVSTAAQALSEQVGELARRLRLYLEQVEFNPQRLDEVEERLSLIEALKRKYGKDLESVLKKAEVAREELTRLSHSEARLGELVEQEATLLKELGRLGEELSTARRGASKTLAEVIGEELSDLRMSGAEFAVDMAWEDDPAGAIVGDRTVAVSPFGLDQVEFLVAPNPGEGLKPLAKIASGGETSRLMLGLKGVLAQADRIPTLIFDEIDQGIGGRVGAIVGQKLWSLARNHQVLCITHLPQLAAYGDQHYKVEKKIIKDRTVTRTCFLSDRDRVPELANMLGGETDSNLESSAELLRQARDTKL